MNSLILGMGNTLLSDDAIGIIIKRYLERILKDVCRTDFRETSWGGFRIIDLLRGYDFVIVIDSIKTGKSPAGYIHHLNLNDLLPTLRLNSYHDINFITAIKLAETYNEKMPENIEILAIEVDNTNIIQEQLSKEISDSIYSCSLEIIKILENKNLLDKNFSLSMLKKIETEEELSRLYAEEEITN